VLFIAAGAFHVAKPRISFPSCRPLPHPGGTGLADRRGLRAHSHEPENALTKQYTALLATEKIHLDIQADAIAEIARIAAEVNARMENIGARRLHTVMERLLDELAFEAPELGERTIP